MVDFMSTLKFFYGGEVGKEAPFPTPSSAPLSVIPTTLSASNYSPQLVFCFGPNSAGMSTAMALFVLLAMGEIAVFGIIKVIADHADQSFYSRNHGEEDAIGSLDNDERRQSMIEQSMHSRIYQSSSVSPPPPHCHSPLHKDTSADYEPVCSICLVEYEDGDVLCSPQNCHHEFHMDCLSQWLQRRDSCPLCRNQVMSRLSDSGTAGLVRSRSTPSFRQPRHPSSSLLGM